jgi:hypothetical protein
MHNKLPSIREIVHPLPLSDRFRRTLAEIRGFHRYSKIPDIVRKGMTFHRRGALPVNIRRFRTVFQGAADHNGMSVEQPAVLVQELERLVG